MYATAGPPKSVNIGLSNDPFNRYKTQQLSMRTTSKNRTHLVNLDQVAMCLKTKPMHILTFMGYTLGTKVECHTHAAGADFFVAGTPSVDAVHACLDKFIKEMILCSRCGLPELVTVKNEHTCRSCGRCGPAHVSPKFAKYLKK